MSEQTKNKPNTAGIVVSIICVLILIVTLGLFCEKRNKYRPRGRIPPAERSRREPVPTR